MRRLRDALLVASFDLGAALRSRRALVLIGLYLAGACASALLFTEILGEVENAVAAQIGVAATRRPGTMSGAIMDSPELREVLSGLVGDGELVGSLLTIPPLALFYGWVVFTFTPVMVAIGSSDAIVSDLASGACRFSLVRTDRLSWVAGKLIGQVAVIGVAIAAGGAGVFAVGAIRLARFAPVDTALWLVRLGARGWLYSFAWLGAVLGASLLTRTSTRARGLALMVLLVFGIGGVALSSDLIREKAPVLADLVLLLLPRAHRLDLWRPALVDRLPALVMLPALGIGWFSLGCRRFLRKDA